MKPETIRTIQIPCQGCGKLITVTIPFIGCPFCSDCLSGPKAWTLGSEDFKHNES